jgi:signal transduction histidine kinase
MQRPWLIYILVGGLAILLAAIGLMQYHALSEASSGDADKAQRRVKEDAERFASDFNREIQNAYFNFQTDAAVWKNKDWQPFNERYDYWREKTSYPDLISGIYFFEAKGDAKPLKYDRESRAFIPVDETEELAGIRSRAADDEKFDPFLLDRYVLLLPIHDDGPEVGNIVFHRVSSAGMGHMVKMPERYGILAIKLDLATISNRVLPDLTAKYFGDGEFRAGVTGTAGEPVFGSITGESDASAKLFTLSPDNFIEFRHKELLDSIGSGEKRSDVVVNSTVETRTFDKHVTAADGKEQTFKIELSGKPRTAMIARSADAQDAPWTLAVQHSSGSIDAYIASTFRRNLAIGFGVLFLLGAAVGAIIVSSMRARALAQRQLDFVSSVSHEFRTPLAVIYSAGENLADGVAKDASQTSRYGDLIKGEGLKLTAMVEQILEFAGARSGKQRYNFHPVRLGDVIDDAMKQCKPLIDERHADVDVNIADALPAINADKRALGQAIQNLVANSIKYSNGSPRLRIAAANGDGKVRISVEDNGIGIAKKDLKQIFEPFYRAKDVVDAQIHGNGLGLSLVKQIAEAHRGRVSVVSETGKGSKFTIEIPSEKSET